MNPILIQTLSYMVVLVISILIVSFLLRGFFWKFVKVRLSFGRLVLIKIRSVNRDHYSVGNVHENFLIFKVGNSHKRISIPDQSVFYRSLGIAWVDVDDSKNALVKTDFSSVEGFDAVKYNNLYLRALYKPQIVGNQEKIIIISIIAVGLIVAITLYLVYNMNNNIGELKLLLNSLKAGAVVSAGGL